MKYLFQVCFLVFSIGTTLNSFSQLTSEQIRFRHLTSNDGLPHNIVYNILRDKEGFIWMGTYGGLCRYDGYSFKIFKHDPADSNSLYDNSVFCITEDDDGNIWCGNRRSGLSILNPRTGKFKRYKNNPDDSTSLNQNDIRAMCKDKDGDIWLATGRGICKYNKGFDNFIQYNHNTYPGCSSNNFALFPAADGIIWIGSHDVPLTFFDKKTEIFTRLPFDSLYNSDKPIVCCAAVSITIDKNQLLWAGSRFAGLNVYDLNTRKSFRYLFNQPAIFRTEIDFWRAGILADANNNVWIGTSHKGLYYFDGVTGKFLQFQNNPHFSSSISHNTIRGIYEDFDSTIWIGTGGGGVNIFNKKTADFTVYQPIPGESGTLSGNDIKCLFEDSHGILWVGITDVGVNVFDNKTGKFTH